MNWDFLKNLPSQDKFDLHLCPRLTAAAAAKLASIMSALQEVYLQEGERIEAQEGGLN